ncbi:MAG TPA: hypothetical protein VF763_13635 [Candidatus Limnocylindrales bacterium]
MRPARAPGRLLIVGSALALVLLLAVAWFAWGGRSADHLARAGASPTDAPSALASPPAGSTPTAAAQVTPGVTPRPAATPAGSVAGAGEGGELRFPIRAAFYYPWFPESWSQAGFDPFTNYHPSLGFYSTLAVVRQHIAALQYGGIQAGIASWWGQGSQTDTRLPALLAAARGTGFRWAVYYEPEGQGDPAVSRISADLAYIGSRYGHDPAYLRVGGRFVVFVYADPNDRCGMADRWARASAGTNAYVVLKIFPGYRGCASQPAAWHQYNPATAQTSVAGSAFTVSPGFWKKGDPSPRLARDPVRFQASVQAMVASGAPWQLVTTFDEWGEGTAVESATEWASPSGYGVYLDILHEVR